MLFDEEIVIFKFLANSKEHALKTLSDCFLEKDLVTPDFYDGIITRESNYPTGLFVNETGVAIPHTDGDKVKRSQIGFMSLSKPVKFMDMADKNKSIDVKLIFMLALKEANEQLTTLQKLIDLFQNKNLIGQLKECTSIEEFKNIMTEAGIE